jgi:hypothetical protein
MENSFDPMNRLKTVLGPKPNHPWGAIIPQVLLWSFRRFCFNKLVQISEILENEQLWDDHMELIHLYAPRGLESVAASWFSPESVDHVYSSLEQYNRFFLEFLIEVDEILISEDADGENNIANFLDDGMGFIIRDWLGEEYGAFLIFPMNSESEDEFTDEQLTKLVTALVEFSLSHPPVEEFAEVESTRLELPMYKINIEAFFRPKPIEPQPEPAPESESQPEQVPRSITPPPPRSITPPVAKTFRDAFAHRRTHKNRPALLRRNTRKRIAPILR